MYRLLGRASSSFRSAKINAGRDPRGELKKFLNDRAQMKVRLYRDVIGWGIFLVAVGTFFSFMRGPLNIAVDSYSNMILLLITNLIRVLGICILSTVPTDEFDPCKYFATHKLYRQRFSGFLLLSVLIIPTSMIISQYKRSKSMISCACAYLFIPICLRCLTDDDSEKNEDLRYRNLTMLFISTTPLILLALSINILLSPDIFYASLLHRMLAFAGCLLGLLLIICMCASVLIYDKIFHLKYDITDDDTKVFSNFVITKNITSKEGWGWLLFSNSVYICAVIVGFGFLLEAVLYSVRMPSYGGENQKLLTIQNYLLFVIDVIPFLLVILLNVIFRNDNFCFTLFVRWFFVRWFEYHPQRLLEDGLMLAEMIKNWDGSDEGLNLYWQIRKNCPKDIKQKRNILRDCFMPGSIIKPKKINDSDDGKNKQEECDNKYMDVEFSFHVDANKSWCAWYEHDKLKFQLLNDTIDFEKIQSSELNNQSDFDAWSKENFDVEKVKIDKVNKNVTVKVPIPAKLSKTEITKFAHENMRYYVLNFKDDKNKKEFEELLRVSPRGLTPEQKQEAYKLSNSFWKWPFSMFQKVDYFVSHSWEDEHNKKYDAIVNHFTQKNVKCVTLWLDKVCLDPNDDEFGLAVLPLNINKCQKFLVVLSCTYLTRLWCVWELFTLLLFCNKELALERIEIVFIEGEDRSEIKQAIRYFELDSMHCFGPNDEKKIRSLVRYVEESYSDLNDKEYDKGLIKSIMNKLLDHKDIRCIKDKDREDQLP